MFRTSKIGVYNEKGEVIHIAHPCDLVPELVKQLFYWTATSKAHMLIKSSYLIKNLNLSNRLEMATEEWTDFGNCFACKLGTYICLDSD